MSSKSLIAHGMMVQCSAVMGAIIYSTRWALLIEQPVADSLLDQMSSQWLIVTKSARCLLSPRPSCCRLVYTHCPTWPAVERKKPNRSCKTPAFNWYTTHCGKNPPLPTGWCQDTWKNMLQLPIHCSTTCLQWHYSLHCVLIYLQWSKMYTAVLGALITGWFKCRPGPDSLIGFS